MSKTTFTSMKVTGLSVVVPDYPKSIDDDLRYFDDNPAKLARAKKTIGYGTRYNTPPGCTPTDLCISAISHLQQGMDLDMAQVDGLICVLQKPDYCQPGSSFIIQKHIGLPKTCVCLDINQGCPGFVYGLWLAGNMIQSGSCRKILVTIADYYSSSPDSRGSLLFGAAGAVALVEYSPSADPAFFHMGADGTYYESIIIPAGGARLPIKKDILDLPITNQQGDPVSLTDDYTSSLDVFNLNIREIPINIRELYDYAKTTPEEIDFAALHQVNKQTVDHIARKAGLTPEQYSTKTFSEYGNQSSASVPGVLAHILGERLSAEKFKLLLSAYGIGPAWGSCILTLDHTYCAGVIKEKFDAMPSRESIIDYWVKKIGEKA